MVGSEVAKGEMGGLEVGLEGGLAVGLVVGLAEAVEKAVADLGAGMEVADWA